MALPPCSDQTSTRRVIFTIEALPDELQAVQDLSFRSSLADLDAVDRGVRAAFERDPSLMRAWLPDIDFARGRFLENDWGRPRDSDGLIGAVGFCFQNRLRRSLQHLFDVAGRPIDGIYIPVTSAVSEFARPAPSAPLVGVETLLAGCVRRLAYIPSMPLPAAASLKVAFSPYLQILDDLLERGASTLPTPSRDGDLALSWTHQPIPVLALAWAERTRQRAEDVIPAGVFKRLLVAADGPDAPSQLLDAVALRTYPTANFEPHVSLLRELHADFELDLEAMDSNRKTPLARAISLGNAVATEILLRAGSPVAGREIWLRDMNRDALKSKEPLVLGPFSVAEAIAARMAHRPDLIALARCAALSEDLDRLTPKPSKVEGEASARVAPRSPRLRL